MGSNNITAAVSAPKPKSAAQQIFEAVLKSRGIPVPAAPPQSPAAAIAAAAKAAADKKKKATLVRSSSDQWGKAADSGAAAVRSGTFNAANVKAEADGWLVQHRDQSRKREIRRLQDIVEAQRAFK